MSTNMQRAQDILFGRDGLGATNFKMFPGVNSDRSAEQVAGALAASFERLVKGELEEVELDD